MTLKMTKLKNFYKLYKVEIIFFFVFVIYRLPLLGLDIINTDAPRWKSRIYEFSSALFSGNFAGTNVTYHPGVTLMWIGTFAVKVSNLFQKILYGAVDVTSPSGYSFLHFWEKFFVVLTLSIFLTLGLYVLRRLYGNLFTLIFFVFLTFEPLFLAFSRVLHTDALVTTLLFSSSLFLYYGLLPKKISKRWVVLSSLAAALAVLSKSNSLLVFPFSGLLMMVVFLGKFNKKTLITSFKKIIVNYLFWFVITVGLIFLLWPALWVSPVQTITDYWYGITGVGIEEGHFHKWMGLETNDPGWVFYPITYFIRFPPTLVISSFCGIFLFIYGVFKYRKLDKLLLLSLFFIFTYLLMMSSTSKKLDRYILPTIPYFVLFGTYYISVFLRVIKKYNLPTVFFVASLVFTSNFMLTYKTFPNYLSYYSSFIGGYAGGKFIDNSQWPFGHREFYLYVNSLPNAKTLTVFLRKPFLYDPYLYNVAYDVVEVKNLAKPGDLFILKGNDDWEFLNEKSHKFIKIVKVGDIDYFWVFQFK